MSCPISKLKVSFTEFGAETDIYNNLPPNECLYSYKEMYEHLIQGLQTFKGKTRDTKSSIIASLNKENEIICINHGNNHLVKINFWKNSFSMTLQ